jgi:hypothetical protein
MGRQAPYRKVENNLLDSGKHGVDATGNLMGIER